jgi:hypothetical protein
MTWVAASLVLTTLPLIEGREQGWPAWTWVSMAAGIAGLVGFVPVERAVKRRGDEPLVNMALFNENAFRVGLAVQLVFWMGQAAFFSSSHSSSNADKACPRYRRAYCSCHSARAISSPH